MRLGARRQAFLGWLAKTFAVLASGCILVAGVILAITMQSWHRVTLARLVWPNLTFMVALVGLAVLHTVTALAIRRRGDDGLGLAKTTLMIDVGMAGVLAVLAVL